MKTEFVDVNETRKNLVVEIDSEVVDQEIDRLVAEPVSNDELERAKARTELGLLQGLQTNEGKASTIGFYEVVLGNPAAGFERLQGLSELRPGQLRDLAGRYLNRRSRTIISVEPQAGAGDAASDESEEEAS